MTLSTLIKKGGLTRAMTVTVATVATVIGLSGSCVAGVATVTVARGAELASELLTHEENNVRAWLAHIEERGPATITEVLDSCCNDLAAHQCFLKRSEEMP